MEDRKRIFFLDVKGTAEQRKLTTAADIEPHIADLRANDVEEVHLEGHSLGVEACKVLGEVLATKKNLKVANLSDIFTKRGLSELPEALSHLLASILNLPKLYTVKLNDNAIGYNARAPVVAFLSAHVPLQHLHLNNNGLGPDASIEIAEALQDLWRAKKEAHDAGQVVPYLETVICGRNRLEKKSMKSWAETYSMHSNIRVVKMVQNGIFAEGILPLIEEGLAKCAYLEVLDLQDNMFDDDCSSALASAVSNWTSLRELGVGDCVLGAKGAKRLAEALSEGKHTQLETLRLFYNEIDADGVKEFAKLAGASATGDVVLKLPALKRIELNSNEFRKDDENAAALRDLLRDRKDAAEALELLKEYKDPVEKRGILKRCNDVVDLLELLRELLRERKNAEWGMDELDDLEEPEESDNDSQNGEEEEEEDEEKKKKREEEEKKEEKEKKEREAEEQRVAERKAQKEKEIKEERKRKLKERKELRGEKQWVEDELLSPEQRVEKLIEEAKKATEKPTVKPEDKDADELAKEAAEKPTEKPQDREVDELAKELEKTGI